MKKFMLGLLVGLIIIGLLVGVVYLITSTRTVPQCAEDVFILGVGDFVEGRWSSYVCGPALDDLLPAR